jgi:hypothetical protein
LSKPSWDTPAHLVGLPYTNWKRKTGFEMRGTLAECIQRWLSLPQHQQQNCTLTNDAAPGRWGPASIRAHVAVHGVPPQMGTVPPDKLKDLTEKQLPAAEPFKGIPDSTPRPWDRKNG